MRRAPVQREDGHPEGTIPWETHLLAWAGYDAAGHGDQSAERTAQRGGFGYSEAQHAIAGHYMKACHCAEPHPPLEGWELR